MKLKPNNHNTGSVLICVLGAILILSLIGANVLQSSATRLNASVKHVRAWKESLSAAESGVDIAFAEIRTHKAGSNPATWWTGWTQSGTTYTPPVTTFGNNLVAQSVVDECYFDSTTQVLTMGKPASGNSWYRIRSKGTAPLPDLKRTGMDDVVGLDSTKHFAAFGSTEMQDITARGKGDSLLRKIDFNVDHFTATYGPNGDGLNKAIVPPTSGPSISRRIEQLAMPVTPFFDAAIKARGSFYGLGSASYIDSYDSRNGAYDSTVRTNPSSPYYADSHEGNVQVASATATIKGDIYGDVATDGGTVITGSPGIVYGTIDNNVPFVLENYSMPSTTGWLYTPLPIAVNRSTDLTPLLAGTSVTPNYYLFSSISDALRVRPALIGGEEVDTYVAIHVTGNISGNNAAIRVDPKVHLRIYFDGNINVKADRLRNESPSATNPYAANMQFFGISPSSGTQTVEIDSGGGQPQLAMTFYAPSANIQFKGAPDFIGTVVCNAFYANGNITWHYDRALNDEGELLDYRLVSYVEDHR
jgi:Tfp pilus assembly protein PilX